MPDLIFNHDTLFSNLLRMYRACITFMLQESYLGLLSFNVLISSEMSSVFSWGTAWSVKCCKTAVNFGQLKLVFCRKLYPLNQTKASQGHKQKSKKYSILSFIKRKYLVPLFLFFKSFCKIKSVAVLSSYHLHVN